MHSTQHFHIAHIIVVSIERLILNIMPWSLLMRLYLKVKEHRACRLVFDKRTNADFILSIFHQLNLNKQH